MAVRKRLLSDSLQPALGRLRMFTVAESVAISAATQDTTLSIPKGAVVLGGGVYVETAISGTGVSTATITIGDTADADGYMIASELAVDAGSNAIFAGARVGEVVATADNVTVTVGGSAAWAGQVSVVLHYALAEAPDGAVS